MSKATTVRAAKMLGVLLVALSSQGFSQELAATPPMGWNSWYAFHTEISDEAIRRAADALVSSGLRDRGYTYVNLDDGWEGGRDTSGNIEAGPKFPDMKALGVYLHQRGLKFGIYSSPAKLTPGGFTGSFGHEAQDAAVYAAWGVDYLKYDWGYASKDYPTNDVQGTFGNMRKALDATGRRMVFSISAPLETEPWKWAPASGVQLWRVSQDIEDSWPVMSHIGFDIGAGLTSFPGPGHWNDPDMLQVGHHAMSEQEHRTQVSLWALLAAPLLISNDFQKMTSSDLRVLSNHSVLAIDQDGLGRSGYRLSKDGEKEIWVRQLDSGAWAIGFFNRGPARQDIFLSPVAAPFRGRQFLVRDVWAGHQLSNHSLRSPFSVPAHGIVLLRLEPVPTHKGKHSQRNQVSE